MKRCLDCQHCRTFPRQPWLDAVCVQSKRRCLAERFSIQGRATACGADAKHFKQLPIGWKFAA